MRVVKLIKSRGSFLLSAFPMHDTRALSPGTHGGITYSSPIYSKCNP